ncbi:hypothetical protein PanWU01x14_259250 [Parasponia andersonii]|uniref:Uncharacterized protein n=1 Tax=Parasponia andersonii TaxID=3476 RepID=A0A2P5B9E1_PARAD|nr:hypothetical protein PanWU01x14_259250 [Parasponia andersonii]
MPMGSDRLRLQIFPLDDSPKSAPTVVSGPVPRKSTVPVSEKLVLPRTEWRRVVTESVSKI